MAFFEDLEKYVTKYAKILGDKATNIADASAKKINIYTQREKISKLYNKLGKYIYENRFTLGENEIGNILGELEEAHAVLEKLSEKSQKEFTPKYRTCSCGTKVRSDFEYCPKCGKKI